MGQEVSLCVSQNINLSFKHHIIYFNLMLFFVSISDRRTRSLPHYVNRTQQEGSSPFRQNPLLPESVSLSRDLISIPPTAPPLRRPPPPQYTAPGTSQRPRHKRRVQRTPSPPVIIPIIRPLMEMGFSISQIETALEETGRLLSPTFLLDNRYQKR